jgi:hypothetical protein
MAVRWAGGFGRLAGTWRRILLVEGNGGEDVSTEVTWLQGVRSYLDLRRPPGRPPFDGVRGLRDLDLDQVRWLAGQEAFAGVLTDRGDHVEWTRHIDLHPPGPYPDAGTLRERNGLLVEQGWHAHYIEHWRRSPGATDPSWAMVLGEIGTGARARLLRVGMNFGWARGRRRELVRHQALREFVDAAGSASCRAHCRGCRRAPEHQSNANVYPQSQTVLVRASSDLLGVDDGPDLQHEVLILELGEQRGSPRRRTRWTLRCRSGWSRAGRGG